MNIDFAKTAKDYAQYRAGFPPEFFRRIADFGVGEKGQRLLDLGTGTGTLARGFALRGCQVMGIDPAESLLEQAQTLDEEAGVRISYTVGQAEETGLPAETFDVVTAGQCWQWFKREQAAHEVHRLLRPGGKLVIAHFDWLPLPGGIVAATEALILKHNPDWKGAGGKGLYPQWLDDMAAAGFGGLESFDFDSPTEYSHEAWRGRVRASAGVAASLEPEQVESFDEELDALLAADFPQEPLSTPHKVFAALGRKD